MWKTPTGFSSRRPRVWEGCGQARRAGAPRGSCGKVWGVLWESLLLGFPRGEPELSMGFGAVHRLSMSEHLGRVGSRCWCEKKINRLFKSPGLVDQRTHGGKGEKEKMRRWFGLMVREARRARVPRNQRATIQECNDLG